MVKEVVAAAAAAAAVVVVVVVGVGAAQVWVAQEAGDGRGGS